MNGEEFKQKTYKLVNELTDYISKLEDKAGEIAEDAKETYRDRINYLKDLKDNLTAKFEEYNNRTNGKWDILRDSVANFFTSVSEAWKENYAKVADAFKYENGTGHQE